jgi:hypothetical protein
MHPFCLFYPFPITTAKSNQSKDYPSATPNPPLSKSIHPSYKMLFSPFLPLLTVSIIPTVYAGCYKSGKYWTDPSSVEKHHAISFVDSICNPGGVSGNFEGGETKYRCRQIYSNGESVKQEFWVERKGDGATLDDAMCREKLKNEILGCDQGGSSGFHDWNFR